MHCLLGLLLLALCGCQARSDLLEPTISYLPPTCTVVSRPSAFPPLTAEERSQDWGKELTIASAFAHELDLYRAITSYKRALFFMPQELSDRRLQIIYSIMQSYYLGKKYQEVVDTFENSAIKDIPATFPAFDDLLLMLYDSYQQTGQLDKSCQILSLIETRDLSTATNLKLSEALSHGDLNQIALYASDASSPEDVYEFLEEYNQKALSVQRAQTLNALLPGAGYYYVGQKKAAVTSFLINALFIAAAYQFFHHGNVAAGIITTSFEMGWYFGGINGAGLAAKEFNERHYENSARDFMISHCLFPVLMFSTSF